MEEGPDLPPRMKNRRPLTGALGATALRGKEVVPCLAVISATKGRDEPGARKKGNKMSLDGRESQRK